MKKLRTEEKDLTTVKERTLFFLGLVFSTFRGHAASGLFLVGTSLIVIGGIFDGTIDAYFDKEGVGRTLLNIGSATLGAGVFAIIMQTSTYLNMLKKNLYSVIYTPEKERPYHTLISSWTNLTESILRSVLPIVHTNAAETIKNKFFDEEIDFHFEQYRVEFDVSIGEDESVTIIESITANIYLSPHRSNPIFEQSSEVKGKSKLLSLRLNGKMIDTTQERMQEKIISNGVEHNKISIPLNEYVRKEVKNGLSERMIKFERVEEYYQPRLDIEPYILGDLSRYTKGYEVKARITEGYNLFFETLGMSKTVDNPDEVELDRGWKSWIIADNDVTLLPGSGFILVIAKKPKVVESCT